MPDKDVNVHVRTPGADKAKEQLDAASESVEKIGKKAKQSGHEGAAGGGEHEASLGRLEKTLISLGLKYLGFQKAIQLGTQAIRAQIDALKEHAEVAQRQQLALVRLQFLGDFFTENPQARKEVAAMAEFGRRPFEEVAGAWYNLKSKAAAMTSQQRQEILKEALETGRTDPSMPLDTLVDMFSLYAKQTGQADANRIQNVIQQTITEAGGGGADVAKYMPQFLPVGLAGGLSGAESAGLWAYVTTQMSEPSIATTGLRATFMGLQGKGAPESQKLLAKFGVTPEMSFAEKIKKLSAARQAGGLDLGAAEQLAGREGSAVLLSMLKNPAEMQRTIANVVGADRGDVDITKQKIEQIFGADEVARQEEEMRRLDVENENLKAADKKAMAWKAYILQREVDMRKMGKSEVEIKLMQWGEWGLSVFGREPGDFQKEYGPVSHSYAAPSHVNITHNNNVVYQKPAQPAEPRSAPGDLR